MLATATSAHETVRPKRKRVGVLEEELPAGEGGACSELERVGAGPVPEITLFLDVLTDADERAAERLLEVVYAELRLLAMARLAREAPGHSLQPTAPVDGAWLRLVGDEQRDWNDQRYFFAAWAEAMRRNLVERARKKTRGKRAGDRQRVEVDDVPATSRWA